MKIYEVQNLLDAQIWVGEEKKDIEVYMACGCDLMSDVLAFVKDRVLLLTGLVNPQVIRTAEMMDIKVIVFVRGKKPTAEILELAKNKKMIILSTDYPMYASCGILYSNGLQGRDMENETSF